MKKTISFIGLGVLIGWVLAILLNYQIYTKTTAQGTFIHPVLDPILFMLLMFIIFIVVTQLYRKKESYASIALSILGILSIALIFLYV